MDELDRKLLRELKTDASAPMRKVASKLGVPATTLYYRKKVMESKGIIKRYRAVADMKKAGYSHAMLVLGRTAEPERLLSMDGIEMVLKLGNSRWNAAALLYVHEGDSMDRIAEKLRSHGFSDIAPISVEEVIE